MALYPRIDDLGGDFVPIGNEEPKMYPRIDDLGDDFVPIGADSRGPTVGQDVPGVGATVLTPDQEDSWGTTLRKSLENVPDSFKAGAGSLVRMVGTNMEKMQTTAMQEALSATGQSDQEIADLTPQIQEANRSPLTATGKGMYDEAHSAIQANQPNVPDRSGKWYVGSAARAVGEMTPAIAAGLLTRSTNVGLSVMAANAGGNQYGESLAKGRTHEQAQADGLFTAITETIGEHVPLGFLMQKGGVFLKRLLKTAGAEGAEEMVTETLQAGYDAGVIGDKMTLGEAGQRIIDAGIIGAMAGGTLGAAAHPFVKDQEEGLPTPQPVPQPVPRPPGERARAASSPPVITPEDEASPIPTHLIAQGRQVMQETEATGRADAILARNGFPRVNTRVSVTLPNGAVMTGTVTDAFQEGDNPLDAGMRVELDNGQVIDELFSRLGGVQIQPLPPVAASGKVAVAPQGAVSETAPPAENKAPDYSPEAIGLEVQNPLSEATNKDSLQVAPVEIPASNQTARESGAIALLDPDTIQTEATPNSAPTGGPVVARQPETSGNTVQEPATQPAAVIEPSGKPGESPGQETVLPVTDTPQAISPAPALTPEEERLQAWEALLRQVESMAKQNGLDPKAAVRAFKAGLPRPRVPKRPAAPIATATVADTAVSESDQRQGAKVDASSGELPAPSAVSPEAMVLPAEPQRSEAVTPLQPDDILGIGGKPFATEKSAALSLRMRKALQGQGYAPAQVEGGWVLRKKTTSQAVSSPSPSPEQQVLPEESHRDTPEPSTPPLRIEPLSDKEFVVLDPNQAYKERVKQATHHNPLWHAVKKGWTFPKAQEAKVREALADLLPDGFVRTSTGSVDFGQINAEQAVAIGGQPGPIRLRSEGESPGEKHINRPERLRQLEEAGYQNARELIEDVGQNFNAIYRGTGNSKILAKRNGKALIAFVELMPDNTGGFYDVRSGLVSREGYLKNKTLLWEEGRRPDPHRPVATRTDPVSALGPQQSLDPHATPSGENSKTDDMAPPWEASRTHDPRQPVSMVTVKTDPLKRGATAEPKANATASGENSKTDNKTPLWEEGRRPSSQRSVATETDPLYERWGHKQSLDANTTASEENIKPVVADENTSSLTTIRQAYDRLVARNGWLDPRIAEVHREVGSPPLEPFKKTLREALQRGEAVASLGDSSLSTQEEREAAIEINGEPHLRIRFLKQPESGTPETSPSVSGESVPAGSYTDHLATTGKPYPSEKSARLAASNRADMKGRNLTVVQTGENAWVLREYDGKQAVKGGKGDVRPAILRDDAAVVRITGDELGAFNTVKEFRLKALERAKRDFVGKTYTNQDSGDRIEVTTSGVKHTISHGADDLIRSIVAIPELIANARKVGIEVDNKDDPNTRAVHRYEVNLEIGARSFGVILVAKERFDGTKYYDHSFKKEEGPTLGKETPPTTAQNSRSGAPEGKPIQGRAQQQNTTSPEEGNKNPLLRKTESSASLQDHASGVPGSKSAAGNESREQSRAHAHDTLSTPDSNSIPSDKPTTTLTPEAAAKLPEIEREVRGLLERIAPHARVKIVDEVIVATVDGKEIRTGGDYTSLLDLIRVALNQDNPLRAARHETIHHLRNMGFFRTDEWQTLRDQARNVWRQRYGIDDTYRPYYEERFSGNEALIEEALDEEAIAEAFADFRSGGVRGEGRGIPGMLAKARTFWNRIREILGRVFGRPVTSDEIFAKIDRGEVGRRTPGSRRVGGVRPSREA
ncbi:MAG: hypothetical protein HQL56_06945, partial [Magnetococcales bacterium]|nr:hypothetical protein [Magnetococcales bacterium]